MFNKYISAPIAGALYHLYPSEKRHLRALFIQIIAGLEGGEFRSQTLRHIFRDYHRVDIGLFSHGDCFVPGSLDCHTTVGRYCSIAKGVRVMNRNHPLEFKSTHAYFFNPQLGFCRDDIVDYIPLKIGNDVWIGANALILPHVRRIGDGAVIAAGAVVNKDVPPYAVVVGNPARAVRLRFPKDIVEALMASRWWEKPLEELDPGEFCRPFHNGVPDGEAGP